MKEHEIELERERARHARRLGGYDKTCVLCGESDPRCLELHHLARKGYGEELVSVCRNCHRKVTDAKSNRPVPTYTSTLEQIGYWLLGVGEFLLELARTALRFGQTLIEAAKVCPAPYGYRVEAAK